MFKKLIQRYTPSYYLQVWENKVKLTDFQREKELEIAASIAIKTENKPVVVAIGDDCKKQLGHNVQVIKPFSHPRSIIAEFEAAEKIIQHMLKTFANGSLITATPSVVVHPMEKVEGGLTQIEIRAFNELAYGAGARQALVIEGDELNKISFDFEKLKKQWME